MRVDELLAPSWRCVHFLDAGEAAALERPLADSSLLVVDVDATDLLTDERLLRTLGEVFRFPDYYGQNYSALDECLRDLDWLPAPGYVLRMAGAQQLWRDAPVVGGNLLRTWTFCAEYWSARQAGNHVQPPPTPFHLLMIW